MKLDSSLTIRKMGNQHVVYRVDRKTGERSMIVLNDTAAFLWQKFVSQPSFTLQDLAQALVEEYDIDLTTAMADSQVLIDSWLDSGFACS